MWSSFTIFFSQEVWHINSLWIVHLTKLQTSCTGQPGDELVSETTFDPEFSSQKLWCSNFSKDSQTPKFKKNIFSGSLSPNFQIDASEKPEEILETPNTDAEYSAN